MTRFLRFLLVAALLAGAALLVARLRQRLAAPRALGPLAAGPGDGGETETLPAAAAPEAPVAADHPAPDDDLAEVWGIGPVFRSRLAQAGISTFADLAAAAPTQVAAATGVPPERAADWIAQAAALAAR
jgi:predicted flap endonuclease-1-like 5' DNA nuclease